MQYQHTQTGRLHQIIYPIGVAMLLFAWFSRGAPLVLPAMFAAIGVLTFAIAFSFKTLRVEDEGEELVIRYGPVPLWRKAIPYEKISSVEPDRTSFIDGWGIHWLPGRGWTYNVWGFDCVKLTVGRTTLRIGTDDRDNLLAFLRDKISS